MQPRNKEYVCVLGATGPVGMSCVVSFAQHGSYAIRAVTRDPTSEKAMDCKYAGVGIELAKGDMDDVNSLAKVFRGVFGVFAVIPKSNDPELDIQRGKNITDACKTAKIGFLVFVTMEDSRKLGKDLPSLYGDMKIPSWDARAIVTEYMKDNLEHVTPLHQSFFYENFFKDLKPTVVDIDGEKGLCITLPMGDCVLPCMACEDIGWLGRSIFWNRAHYGNKPWFASGDKLTVPQMIEILNKETGIKWIYKNDSTGNPEWDNFFKYICLNQAKFCMPRKPRQSVVLFYRLQTWEHWVKEQKNRFLALLPPVEKKEEPIPEPTEEKKE